VPGLAGVLEEDRTPCTASGTPSVDRFGPMTTSVTTSPATTTAATATARIRPVAFFFSTGGSA
jgi:hypothetical protein